MQITLYPHTSHATPHIYPHLETFDVNDGAKRPFPQKLLRVLVDQQAVEARPQYAPKKQTCAVKLLSTENVVHLRRCDSCARAFKTAACSRVAPASMHGLLPSFS